VLQQRMTTWRLAAVLMGWGASALAVVKEDSLIEALARYEWGQPDAALRSLDQAVAAARNNVAARRDA